MTEVNNKDYTNNFERHGLKHSSASQINQWADSPDTWVARYLFGRKLSFGAAAQVGVLVEEVVADTLTGTDFSTSLFRARETFVKDNALNVDDKERARVNDIEPMAQIAIDQLRQYGKPAFSYDLVKGRMQRKIELMCNGDGWKLPIIGYIDFYFPDADLVVDLKTTRRAPSVMPENHKRQCAIYAKAMNATPVKFLYVTPKKHVWHDALDIDETLKEVKDILNRQEKTLGKTREEIVESVPVTKSSFYWRGSESIRKELYGV